MKFFCIHGKAMSVQLSTACTGWSGFTMFDTNVCIPGGDDDDKASFSVTCASGGSTPQPPPPPANCRDWLNQGGQCASGSFLYGKRRVAATACTSSTGCQTACCYQSHTVTVTRTHCSKNGLLGTLAVDGVDTGLVTLERSDRGQEQAIPVGIYPATFRHPVKPLLPALVFLTDVPDPSLHRQRTGVMLHNGNTQNEIEGCILIGARFTSAAGCTKASPLDDGFVVDSKASVVKLMRDFLDFSMLVDIGMSSQRVFRITTQSDFVASIPPFDPKDPASYRTYYTGSGVLLDYPTPHITVEVTGSPVCPDEPMCPKKKPKKANVSLSKPAPALRRQLLDSGNTFNVIRVDWYLDHFNATLVQQQLLAVTNANGSQLHVGELDYAPVSDTFQFGAVIDTGNDTSDDAVLDTLTGGLLPPLTISTTTEYNSTFAATAVASCVCAADQTCDPTAFTCVPVPLGNDDGSSSGGAGTIAGAVIGALLGAAVIVGVAFLLHSHFRKRIQGISRRSVTPHLSQIHLQPESVKHGKDSEGHHDFVASPQAVGKDDGVVTAS